MKSEKKILIVDNRPIFIQSLKFVLKTNAKKRPDIRINVSNSNKDAIEKLNHFSNNGTNIDIIFLNIDMQSANGHELILTKDYINKIRKFIPKIKIIIFSNKSSNCRINYIIRDCKPEGFVMENDIDFKEIIKIFDKALKSEVYYSKSIRNIFKKIKRYHIPVDEIDFYILHYLNLGIKSNYLHNYLPISNSAIEKRKYKLKELFLIEKSSDHQLVEEAVKNGMI